MSTQWPPQSFWLPVHVTVASEPASPPPMLVPLLVVVPLLEDGPPPTPPVVAVEVLAPPVP
jgi:hypothetical protein